MGDTPDGRAGWRRRAAVAGALVAGLVALWFVLAWVFSTDRGLGTQDEGLYLLAAAPPTPTARWVTPFGWHTRPFFTLVGHSVAHLRTFALAVLVVTGALMGHTIGRLLTDDRRGRVATLQRTGLAIVGGLGATLLTAGFLRTPGYNWVNLVGLQLALTGAVLATMLPDGSLWRSGRAHGAAALLALGCWFTVPAKPSTAPLFLAAAAVYVGWHLRRRTWVFAAVTATWVAGFTVLGLVLRWWPTDFLSVLRSTASFPPLDRNQTLPGAFRDVLRTPKVAWRYLGELRPATFALVAVAVGLAVLARHRARNGRPSRVLALAPLAVCAVAAVGTAAPLPVLGLPEPWVRFDWFGTTDAAVLLFAGAALHVVANAGQGDRAAVRRALGVAAMCVVAVVLFGFGSAMGIYPQAALAAGIMWCAAGALVLTVGDARRRTVAVGVVAVAALAMVVTNTVDSRQRPFNGTELLAPIAEQQVPAVVGPYGDDLLLDPASAAFLTDLRAQGQAAGFCPGTPLIGMVWMWTSTTAYALAATVPEHLVLTIFGYPDAADVLDVTIDDLQGPEWRDAWVATTDPAVIEPDEAAQLRAALDRLPDAVGRTFPDDYSLALDLDGFQLWQPKASITRTASCR